MNIELRDYFAVHAPSNCVPKPYWEDIKKIKNLSKGDSDEWAKHPEWTLEFECAMRYRYADIMLKVREQKEVEMKRKKI